MTQGSQPAVATTSLPPVKSRKRELLVFFALAFGIWPVVATIDHAGFSRVADEELALRYATIGEGGRS